MLKQNSPFGYFGYATPHCLQLLLLSLYSVWELVLGFVMLLMMYSYLTSTTSAVIKGIKHENKPPIITNGRRDVSEYMPEEDKQSEKVLILQLFLGIELCFNAFTPIAQSLKQRIHGISKDRFLTWLRSTDTNKVALPTKYFLHSVSMVRDQGCKFFPAHELCMHTVTSFPILILAASDR